MLRDVRWRAKSKINKNKFNPSHHQVRPEYEGKLNLPFRSREATAGGLVAKLSPAGQVLEQVLEQEAAERR
jgi:hypothetical protein